GRGALRPRRRGGGDGACGGPRVRPRAHGERPAAVRPHARRARPRGRAMKRVAVVGGGVAGLAAALRLVEAGRGLEVVLLDANDRLGGTIATERSGGFLIEAGADAFITEKPWAVALCARLGLERRLVGTRPDDRRVHIVRGGRLVPVPEGFALLAPTDLWNLAGSPLFSWHGQLRMLLDLLLPRGPAEVHDGDAVVVAGPSYVAASLLAEVDRTLAHGLAASEYASSAIVTLAYRGTDLPRGLAGFGFVVPSIEQRSILACSYPSRKF